VEKGKGVRRGERRGGGRGIRKDYALSTKYLFMNPSKFPP
jgi:hypothetical protein